MNTSITDMEKLAIEDARRSLWEGIVAAFGEEHGLEIFGQLSPEQVDMIIGRVWDGCRVSMQKQSMRGGVPW